MRKRVRGSNVGLFVLLLFCWCLLSVTSAATAATTVNDGQICPQPLLSDQLKTLAKTVAATITIQGTISGRVTDKSTGAGITGVTVTAYPLGSTLCSSSSSGSAVTDATGNYTISSLTEGSYRVQFSPQQVAPFYISQWYNGILDETQSTIVTVSDPGATPNINAVLEKGGSISGMVSPTRSYFGYSITATGVKGGVGTTTSNPVTGAYTVTGLATDSYTVSCKDSRHTYAGQDYPSPVLVNASGETGHINIILSPGGSITGKVIDANGNPLNRMIVLARQSGAASYDSYDSTDANGSFTIGGLSNGTYDVATNRLSVYISGKKPGVVVIAPASTDIGAIQLRVGGQIKGIIKNPDGALLKNVFVGAYDATGYVNGAETQTDGAYTVTGLDTSVYKIQFLACQGGYAEQWYSNKPSQAAADPVNATSPDTVTGINAVLTLAAANTPPVSVDQSVSTAQNTAKIINLSATDANGDTLNYVIVSSPTHGALSGTAPYLTYTPATGYTGSDSFVFKANDGKADSNLAVVSITVTTGTTSSKGDVNGDGLVNVFDALLTLQYAVGLIEHTPENNTKYLTVADVAPLDTFGKPGGDNVVNVFDALAILRHAVGLDPW